MGLTDIRDETFTELSPLVDSESEEESEEEEESWSYNESSSGSQQSSSLVKNNKFAETDIVTVDSGKVNEREEANVIKQVMEDGSLSVQERTKLIHDIVRQKSSMPPPPPAAEVPPAKASEEDIGKSAAEIVNRSNHDNGSVSETKPGCCPCAVM